MGARGSKSKKRSGANFPSRPPEGQVFFLDRSLGKKHVVTALRGAGATALIHEDFFPPDAQDAVWLDEAGKRGWVVLTKDRKIRYRTLERNALMGAGVRAFVLTAGNLQGSEMAQIFVRSLPAISKFLEKHNKPFIAKITRSGSVAMLFD